MTKIIFEIGDTLTINMFGGRSSSDTVFSYGVTGKITKITEKAIQLTHIMDNDREITAWFPKKAFVSVNYRGNFGNERILSAFFGKWFVADGWTRTFISLATN